MVPGHKARDDDLIRRTSWAHPQSTNGGRETAPSHMRSPCPQRGEAKMNAPTASENALELQGDPSSFFGRPIGGVVDLGGFAGQAEIRRFFARRAIPTPRRCSLRCSRPSPASACPTPALAWPFPIRSRPRPAASSIPAVPRPDRAAARLRHVMSGTVHGWLPATSTTAAPAWLRDGGAQLPDDKGFGARFRPVRRHGKLLRQKNSGRGAYDAPLRDFRRL
jgi:hypothetical protein